MFERIKQYFGIGLKEEIRNYAAHLDETIATLEKESNRRFGRIASFEDSPMINHAAEVILPLNAHRKDRYELFKQFPWLGKGRSVRTSGLENYPQELYLFRRKA